MRTDRPGVTGPDRARVTIGQLAARAGVNPETVRYYERVGVIPPAVRRGAGRYRVYDADDAQRLRFVRRARDLGFSLDEVRALLALATAAPDRSCADVNVLASRQLESVQAKMRHLRALQSELKRLIAACATDTSIGNCSLLRALSRSGEPDVGDPAHGTSRDGRT